jgi:hypothetical protein
VPGNASLPTHCALGTMAAGHTRDIQIAVLVAPSMLRQVKSDASVHGDTADPDNSNNLASKSITVIAKADLSFTKTADASTGFAWTVEGGPLATVHQRTRSSVQEDGGC